MLSGVRKLWRDFCIVDSTYQTDPVHVTLAEDKAHRGNVFGIAAAIESCNGVVSIFSKYFEASSKLQARLHLLREILIRATKVGITHLCFNTKLSTWISLLTGKQAITRWP